MTVKVKLKKLRLKFLLPNACVGGICMGCAKRELKKSGYTLKKSRQLKREILRAVKRTKKQLGKIELVNVKTCDGVEVVIII